MPYELAWLLENRVLYVRYTGVFTQQDLDAYLEESLALRDQAIAVNGENGPLVHTITDAGAVTRQTLNLADAQRSIKALRKQKVGWSLYISDSQIQRFLASLGHQFAGVRYRAFDNFPEALAFLQEADRTLPPLEMPG